jgi:ribonucleoside-diphosphate reductase alpha chain
MSVRRRPEQNLQRALMDHLRARAQPNVYWFHPANGGARTAVEGAILKACGVREGTPDLILIREDKTFVLELKATGSRLSPAQHEAHDELRRAGAEVAIAVGIDDAIGQLERWRLLRGVSAMTARERLPNRHASEQIAFACSGFKFIATVSRFFDGRLAEIFLTAEKCGSDTDVSARDAAVVASIALQHGVPVEVVSKALMRDSQGQPSGPLGVVLDLLAREASP